MNCMATLQTSQTGWWFSTVHDIQHLWNRPTTCDFLARAFTKHIFKINTHIVTHSSNYFPTKISISWESIDSWLTHWADSIHHNSKKWYISTPTLKPSASWKPRTASIKSPCFMTLHSLAEVKSPWVGNSHSQVVLYHWEWGSQEVGPY